MREVPDIPTSVIKVSIKLQRVGEFPLRAAIEDFEKRGSNVERPQDPVNALNIILGWFYILFSRYILCWLGFFSIRIPQF